MRKHGDRQFKGKVNRRHETCLVCGKSVAEHFNNGNKFGKCDAHHLTSAEFRRIMYLVSSEIGLRAGKGDSDGRPD